MDTELARTFLAIVATGSFVRAAERLNVAQTTVSARVRLLEDGLGRPLFVRNKTGASLTPSGEQFLQYAPTLVQLWHRARQQVAIPPGHQSVMAIGGEVSLIEPLLQDWVMWMRRNAPEIALAVRVDVPGDLTNQVASGVIDVAILYAPHHRPGLKIDLVLEEQLVFATTDSNGQVGDIAKYVAVDWGSDFSDEFSASFPHIDQPALTFSLGPLALNYVLAAGGSGYFRRSVVEPYLATGQLHLVKDAPSFAHPVYAVASAATDPALVATALAGLRAVASPFHAPTGKH